MKYGSKNTALRIDAQGADPILHPGSGAVVGHKKSLVAEFGSLGAEHVPVDEKGEPLYRDADGAPYVAVEIFGGKFWDSQIAQYLNGWTDQERLQVEQMVEYFCDRQPDLVWRLEAPVLQAPWPTFDTQDDQNAVAVAIETGQAEVALAYARQTERKKVVKELEAYLAERAAEAEAEQALTAA